MNIRYPQLLPNRTIPLQADFASNLAVDDRNVYPLPGGTGPRLRPDPRLKDGGSSTVTYYEHIATVQHVPSGRRFVCFRQTVDAMAIDQNDPVKYPKWLILDPLKQTELKIFVYEVTANPKKIRNLRAFTEWLAPVQSDEIFNTIVDFLLANQVLVPDMVSRNRTRP